MNDTLELQDSLAFLIDYRNMIHIVLSPTLTFAGYKPVKSSISTSTITFLLLFLFCINRASDQLLEFFQE